MSRTITTEFEAIWKRKTIKKAVSRVRYKRRYWNGSAYVYESDWQVINQDEIGSIGDISMSLDTAFLSVFTTSNVTIVLNNLQNQWLDIDSSPSVFAIDAVATTGYDAYKTKFNIQFGYILDSTGVPEWLSLFTGLASDYKYNPKNGGVRITIVGNELLMQTSDASNVTDTFTQETTSPGTGDASNVEFLTVSQGVGKVTEVRVDGVVKTQGADYSISQTDEYNTPALITFTSTSIPPSGEAVDASGTDWNDDVLIEDMVGLLADEAGIGSGVRTISPVLFAGGLSGSKTIDTQAEWEASTFTNIDSKFIVNSVRRRWHLIDNWTDGDFATPTWTNSGPATISGGELVGTSGDKVTLQISLLNALTQGTTVFEDVDVSSGNIEIVIARNEGFGPGGPAGIRLLIRYDGSTVKLYEFDVGASSYSQIGNTITLSGVMKFKIHYTKSTGAVELGVYNGSSTRFDSTTATTGLKPGIFFAFTGNTTVGDVYFSNDIINDMTGSTIGDVPDGSTPVVESIEFDLLAAPSAWGTLDVTEVLNGGSVAYATNVSSTSGSGYDGWVAIGGGNVIASNLKRYLKVRATITAGSVGTISTPEVRKIVANFQTSSVFLSLAINSGRTVYAMIQRLAQIADYEILFDGDGDFLFRSKTANASPTVDLNQGDGIMSISKYDPGYREVINVGRVTYGEYVDEYDGATASEASPTSEERFGRVVRDENFGDILLANDSNLGTARAQIIYENNFTPKKRIRIKTKLIPHLELSDVARISVYDNPVQRQAIWGGPNSPWGGPYSGFGNVLNILARDLDCKVVGIVYNVNKLTCDLELKEL